eukprot:1151173-Rhodomonas_salina.2
MGCPILRKKRVLPGGEGAVLKEDIVFSQEKRPESQMIAEGEASDYASIRDVGSNDEDELFGGAKIQAFGTFISAAVSKPSDETAHTPAGLRGDSGHSREKLGGGTAGSNPSERRRSMDAGRDATVITQQQQAAEGVKEQQQQTQARPQSGPQRRGAGPQHARARGGAGAGAGAAGAVTAVKTASKTDKTLGLGWKGVGAGLPPLVRCQWCGSWRRAGRFG